MPNTEVQPKPSATPIRDKIHEIIFEAETPGGKAFDLVLITTIVLSVAAVMLDSIASVRLRIGPYLYIAEWVFTLMFTVEYLLRLICVRHPLRYATSFFGLVDLMAILPTYVSLVLPGGQSLLVIRAFRLLRVFRVLKLASYIGEANLLHTALRASGPKITVFLVGVASVVITMGTLMYLIEGEANGFVSIPTGIYWAVVTLTTVGFGDITPKTILGQALSCVLMIVGYAIIAVPTGIVSVELAKATKDTAHTKSCPGCGREGHDGDAACCKYCGSRL